MTTAVFDPSRQCRGKVRYETKADAKRGARRTATALGRGDKPGPTRPSRCPHCGHWHFGHLTPELRARLSESVTSVDPEGADAR